MVLVNAPMPKRQPHTRIIFVNLDSLFTVGDYRNYRNYHPSDQANRDLDLSRFESL